MRHRGAGLRDHQDLCTDPRAPRDEPRSHRLAASLCDYLRGLACSNHRVTCASRCAVRRTQSRGLERRVDDWWQGSSQDHEVSLGRWNAFLLNRRLCHGTESRPVASLILERQFLLYSHVARRPTVDLAHWVVLARDTQKWRRPRGSPRNSQMGRGDRSCRGAL